ncbi:fatty acyl-CoA reductase 2, chloroplastic-like isoform X2 [Prosopis cineraria]|uniref:fatty acyl-CoA reductase 2, chloroplastic-like isoform X2 n=1 Tax=Prosopis cineraria TaxID=364024 RepID=UPI00240F9568|nr:fatty acyl-CoA reductase 2, chloroplastic-like isoform X2 [Prosopis cineraria]
MISSLSINFSFPLLKPQTIHYGPFKTINIKNRSQMKNYFSDNKKQPKGINGSVVPSPKRGNGSERERGQGIGIAKFLQGKNYLVTGATGFLGKVFLEKMLRTAPDVGQIFVLIKAKDKEAALNRLKTEIIDSELLKSLEEVYGKNYKTLVMSKLVAVPGCVCEYDLGMDPLRANEIAAKVNVIVNSAASTKFDERYDVALNSNTKGPSHLLNFAKSCKNICLFLHISTAYVSDGEAKIIQESPLCMGESNVSRKRNNISENQTSVPSLDIDNEMRLATNIMELVNDSEVAKEMKILGLERAKIHGWPNTYSFTKAMGEMIITSLKGDIPLAIVRPTVIGSTYKEPFPGWIEGNRFDIRNTQKLMEEMSDEEIREFWFDLGSINWEEYICNIHIPGLRKRVLKSK